MPTIQGIEVDKFTAAYIECALWSSNDESRPDGGDPIDDNYGPEDLDPEALQQMIRDCKAFQEANAADIATWGQAEYWTSRTNPESMVGPSEQAGYDFWLTRNGHGCGFWEEEWGEPGKRLDAAAKKYGERNLYVENGTIFM